MKQCADYRICASNMEMRKTEKNNGFLIVASKKTKNLQTILCFSSDSPYLFWHQNKQK